MAAVSEDDADEAETDADYRLVLPTLNETDSARSVPWELVLSGCTLVTIRLLLYSLCSRISFYRA